MKYNNTSEQKEYRERPTFAKKSVEYKLIGSRWPGKQRKYPLHRGKRLIIEKHIITRLKAVPYKDYYGNQQHKRFYMTKPALHKLEEEVLKLLSSACRRAMKNKRTSILARDIG